MHFDNQKVYLNNWGEEFRKMKRLIPGSFTGFRFLKLPFSSFLFNFRFFPARAAPRRGGRQTGYGYLTPLQFCFFGFTGFFPVFETSI